MRNQYPKSIRVKKLYAMKFEATEQYEKALQKYEEILEEDETNAVNLGRMLYHSTQETNLILINFESMPKSESSLV